MSSSMVETQEALATRVEVSDDTLSVEIADGRIIAAPLVWYPRLAHATAHERKSWRLIGTGRGIHWPGIDEDVRVANLLAGQPSAESTFVQEVAGGPRQAEARAKTDTERMRRCQLASRADPNYDCLRCNDGGSNPTPNRRVDSQAIRNPNPTSRRASVTGSTCRPSAKGEAHGIRAGFL